MIMAPLLTCLAYRCLPYPRSTLVYPKLPPLHYSKLTPSHSTAYLSTAVHRAAYIALLP